MQTELRVATVFVVDDDPDVLISLRFLLETEGFAVRTFADGAALLEACRPAPDDCLVIDYVMPGMDGLELVGRLRERKITAPIVLVTAYPSASLSARAAASGVRHVVPKPHFEENLIAHVEAAMRESAAAGRNLRETP
jgi:FixJ family two-component response regulator